MERRLKACIVVSRNSSATVCDVYIPYGLHYWRKVLEKVTIEKTVNWVEDNSIEISKIRIWRK